MFWFSACKLPKFNSNVDLLLKSLAFLNLYLDGDFFGINFFDILINHRKTTSCYKCQKQT